MQKGLAKKFAQFENDAKLREKSHVDHQTWEVSKNIKKMETNDLDDKFRGQEYELQMNDVSALSEQQYKNATTYEEYKKQALQQPSQNTAVLNYQTTLQQVQQREDELLPKQQEMEELIQRQVLFKIPQFLFLQKRFFIHFIFLSICM